MPFECCVCYTQTTHATTCRTCAVGVICDACKLRLMEEGFTTCPICRSHRPELVNPMNWEVRSSEFTVPSARVRRRREGGVHTKIFYMLKCLFNFLFFQAAATLYGYFTCFLFGFFKEEMPMIIVLLIGNFSLIFSYILISIIAVACGKDRRVHARNARR